MINDYNHSLPPLFQRLLLGILIVSRLATVLTLVYAIMVHTGVLPPPY
jgi:hypothetical protein